MSHKIESSEVWSCHLFTWRTWEWDSLLLGDLHSSISTCFFFFRYCFLLCLLLPLFFSVLSLTILLFFPLICCFITLSLILWSVLPSPARLLSSSNFPHSSFFYRSTFIFSFVIYFFSYLLIPPSILPCPFHLSLVHFPHHLFPLPSHFLPSFVSFSFLFIYLFIFFLFSVRPYFTFST